MGCTCLSALNCVVHKVSNCSNFDFFMQLKNLEDHMDFEHGYDMSSPSLITVSNPDMPMPVKFYIY